MQDKEHRMSQINFVKGCGVGIGTFYSGILE